MEIKNKQIIIGCGIVGVVFLLFILAAGMLGYMIYKPLMAQHYYQSGVDYKIKGWVKESKQMMHKAINTAPNSNIAKEAKHFLKIRLPKSNKISNEAISLNIKGYNFSESGRNLYRSSPKESENYYKQAIERYNLAIKDSPEFEWPYSNIGMVYYNDETKLDEAIKYFKQALQINPYYLNARIYLGLTYFKQARTHIDTKDYNKAKGLLNKALKEFKKAKKLDPENPELKEYTEDTTDYLKMVNKKLKTQ